MSFREDCGEGKIIVMTSSSTQFLVCGSLIMERRPHAWDSPHLGRMKEAWVAVCSQHNENSCTKGLRIL